jgi:superfamily II DNA or RNA helicase
VLELIYNNDAIRVLHAEKQEIEFINEQCSYVVPSAEWSDKYQSGSWNGKISLFSKKTCKFPSGLLSVISSKLKESKIDFKITDNRKLPEISKNCIVDLGEHKFRDYQEKAIQAIKEKTRGILAMCTGAGKTKSSCGIISELSVYPVIFIVPSVSLLKQTVAEFKQSLKPLIEEFGVGEIGGGVCKIIADGVNVATYHTILTAYNQKYSESKKKVVDIEEDKVSLPSLQKQLNILQVDYANSSSNKLKGISKKIKEIEKKIENKQKFISNKSKIRDLVSNCQLLIIDETHLAAEVIENISLKANKAYYKCGLSATPQRMDNQDLRMFGATGSIIHRVSASELIQRGFLVKPYIYSIDLDHIDKTSASYQETYKNAIVLNEQKNTLIKSLAEAMKRQGRPTLILVERLEHGEILQNMIEDCLFVPGGDGGDDKPISDEEMDYRKYQLNRCENNEIILVATQWANTGIDAPKISSLILAGSTGTFNTVIQQVGRVLRKAPGKNNCIVFDFKHKEKNLRNHYYSRAKAYKTEPEFQVKMLKYNSSKGTYV